MEAKAGAQMFTLREHTRTIEDVATTLERVREMGYSAIQISAFGPVDPGQVGQLCRDNGLTVAATHVGWDRFRNDLDAVIEEHRLWGCVHAAIGGLPGEYHSTEGVERFVDELRPVAEGLRAAGIDFSYHNHNHEFVRYGEQTWLAALRESAPPELLNFELDTYWVQAGGADPAQWITQCAGRIPLLHVKDMAVTPDRQQQFAPVGEGNLNWPAILAAAREAGVEWYLVEQDNCYGADPFDCLAASYRNLNRMGLT